MSENSENRNQSGPSPERKPTPSTRAPEAGSPPAAGRISPAEKAEAPMGVPVEEQRHNADPNAPQTQVVPPGTTQHPENETGGVPASSLPGSNQGEDNHRGTESTEEAQREEE
jgi:hypothetical protein